MNAAGLRDARNERNTARPELLTVDGPCVVGRFRADRANAIAGHPPHICNVSEIRQDENASKPIDFDGSIAFFFYYFLRKVYFFL